MSCHQRPPLSAIVDLARADDPDADRHLPLLEQAASILYARADVPADERHMLADQLERWRYQCLNRSRGLVTGRRRALVDLLDVAANAVLERPPRPPRSPRWAVARTGPSACATGRRVDSMDERWEQALDPATPLETAIAWARQTTLEHFGQATCGSPQHAAADRNRGTPPAAGHRILLYAPLYLSSYCINHCLYCYFRYPHPLRREHLDKDAVLAQADYLGRRGFRHLLLVAGDYPRLTSTEYLVTMVRTCVERGFRIAVEVAPQSTIAYARLVRAGASSVTLYQETYQQDLYARFHPRGTKHWFDWRLEGLERAAEAGVARAGLGILLGLGPAAADFRALVEHGRYLADRFPHLQLAFSLPRLRDAPDGFVPAHPVDDETLLRMYCALRLAFPQAELVLSTRERPDLRNQLATICITQLSAESCTSPGGYGTQRVDDRHRQQFPVADHRTAAEITTWLRQAGCGVCWTV